MSGTPAPAPDFNPQMLILGRMSRGLTQTQLAKSTGIHQGTLSRLEAGIAPLSGRSLAAISTALKYPESFFFAKEPVDGPGLPEFYHARKRKSIPVRSLEQVYAHVTIRRIHIERLLLARTIDFDTFPLMPSSEWDNPAKVARTVRAHMHTPPGPIADLTEIVERNGAVVVQCQFDNRQMDGFSRWRAANHPPLFFMNVAMPPDRWRWTLAHELGHVVLHTNEQPSDRIEEEANQFAQELLMPEERIKGQLTNLNFSKLAGLKVYWKVSMQALVYRAYSLGQITDRQRRYLFAQLGRAGYRTREPGELDPPKEQPRQLAGLLDFYRRSLGYTASDLAKLLALNEDEFAAMYGPESGRTLRLVE